MSAPASSASVSSASAPSAAASSTSLPSATILLQAAKLAMDSHVLLTTMEEIRGKFGDIASNEGKAVLDSYKNLRKESGNLAGSGRTRSSIYGYGPEGLAKAMKELGIKPLIKPIRGGTDGSQLSYMGLPCPNIFAGGHNFHGKYEYVPVESMQKATEVIVKIAQLTATTDFSKQK